MKWSVFVLLLITVVGAARGGQLDRLSTFESCDAFVQALARLNPQQNASIYSRALAIEDFGEGQPDQLLVPLSVESCAEVWRNDEFALIFATARPNTSASPSEVALLIVLRRENVGWKMASFRRYEAIGKESRITCQLTSRGDQD
jgi:hypothetical protein